MTNINLSAWETMQSLIAWQRAAESGDFAMLNRLMAQIITDWGYAGNPQDESSYADLSPAEWSGCVKEVSAAIGAMFR
jgi:hypothetical protein